MANKDLQSKRKRPPNFRWEIPGDEGAKSQLKYKITPSKGYFGARIE
jgi:hypothetical protein